MQYNHRGYKRGGYISPFYFKPSLQEGGTFKGADPNTVPNLTHLMGANGNKDKVVEYAKKHGIRAAMVHQSMIYFDKNGNWTGGDDNPYGSMRNGGRIKAQLGVGLGLGTALNKVINRYPEATRVGATRPEQFAAMAAAEEGVYTAKDLVNSPGYKRRLKKEWSRSRPSGYSNKIKPSWSELYNERLTRVNNASIEHMGDKSPFYSGSTSSIGQNITYPGSKKTWTNKSYVNPLGDLKKVSIENVPLKPNEKEWEDVGIEETMHRTHIPLLKDNSNTTTTYRGKEKNITPYAQTLINKLVASPENFNFSNTPELSESQNKASKQKLIDYARNQTEFLTQQNKILLEQDIGNKRYTRKDAERLIQNPTTSGERYLNALTGEELPYSSLNKNPKLKRQTKRKIVRGMNNLAMQQGQDPMRSVAQFGGRIKAQDGYGTKGTKRFQVPNLNLHLNSQYDEHGNKRGGYKNILPKKNFFSFVTPTERYPLSRERQIQSQTDGSVKGTVRGLFGAAAYRLPKTDFGVEGRIYKNLPYAHQSPRFEESVDVTDMELLANYSPSANTTIRGGVKYPIIGNIPNHPTITDPQAKIELTQKMPKLNLEGTIKARSNFAKTDPIKKTRNTSSVAGELKYMPPGGNTFGMLKAEFPFNDVSGFESPKIMASINYNMAAREKKKPKKLWGFKNKRTPKPLAYGGRPKFQGSGPTKEQIASNPRLKIWNDYNTPLTSQEQIDFNKWVVLKDKERNRDRSIIWDKGAYDIQGFWKSQEQKDSDGHSSDLYKKPNHPTFSRQSKHTTAANPGGVWGDDGAFYPSYETSKMYDEKFYDWQFGREPNRPEHFGGYVFGPETQGAAMLPLATVRANKAYGGNTPIANTPEMSRRGLNDLNYDEMYFPGNGERRRKFTMGGMKDSIYYEGLDDYNNVVESGIKHPGDEDWVIDAPNVYEKRINNNSSSKRKAKKKIKSFAELLAEHNNKENTV